MPVRGALAVTSDAPRATRSQHGGANVRLPPPLVFPAFVVLGLVVHFFVWPFHAPLAKVARLVAGGIVLAAGLALNVATNSLFRKSGQNPLPWMPTPSLIAKGPYRYSRNPMYLSVMLLQAGLGLLIDDLWVVLFCIPSLVVIHYTAVLPEEAYLREQLGDAYEKYKSSVRRYL